MKLFDPFQGRIVVLMDTAKEGDICITWDAECERFELWDIDPVKLVQQQWAWHTVASLAHAQELAEEWWNKA